MKSRRTHLLLIVAFTGLIFLHLLIAPFSLLSAEEKPASPSSDVKAAVVIPVAEIVARSTEVQDRLREIENSLADAEPEEEIQHSITLKDTEIPSEKAKLETAFSAGINVIEMRGMKHIWTGLGHELTVQEERVRDRTAQIEAWLGEIEIQLDLWERTKKVTRKESAPNTVLREVEGTINALNRTVKEIRKSRDTVLDLQSRILHHLEIVETALDGIDDQQDKLRRSFLAQQDDPVWKMPVLSGEIAGELKRLAAILKETAADVLKYIHLHIGLIIIQLLFFAALLWLVCWAGQVVKGQAGAGSVSADADSSTPLPHVLASPTASAILVFVALTRGLRMDAPIGYLFLVVIAALPFWLRILSILFPEGLRRFLVGLAVLVLLHSAISLIDQLPILARIMLFLESVIGLILVRLTRRSVVYRRTGQLMKSTIWFHVVDVWLKVVLFAFYAVLGASLLGYRSLAIALGDLAVWGTFAGTAYFGVVRIVEAIVQAVMDAGKLKRLRLITMQEERLLTLTRRGLRALAFFAWIYFVIETLTLWDPLTGAVAGILSARIGYGQVTFSLGALFAFGLTIWISWLLSRFVTYVLDREIFVRVKMPPGIPFALTSFSRYFILMVGVLIALTMLGISFDRLALLISALGVGIGFGLQSVVNNFVSGIILLFERPIRVGDKVELENLYGTVTDIGIRASNVRNFDGADVIVPNADFISARVINWTLVDNKRRIILPVGVTYGTDPTKVLEILESVARSHVEVLVDPVPEALFRGFGESSLDFELRAWTESDRGWPTIMSDLAVATYDALAEAGIEIPFPQRDLHLRSVDRKARDVLSGEIPADEPGEEKEGDT